MNILRYICIHILYLLITNAYKYIIVCICKLFYLHTASSLSIYSLPIPRSFPRAAEEVHKLRDEGRVAAKAAT